MNSTSVPEEEKEEISSHENKEKMMCLRCGEEMIPWLCEWLCPLCGFRVDCTD